MARSLRQGPVYLGLLGLLVLVMAFVATSPAAASPWCVNAQVNNVQKCWGAPQMMETAIATGQTTGLCIGYDLTAGPCVPTGQLAVVRAGYGLHQPWAMGTASALTYMGGNAY
jgi:predicted lysophospholipase L1 biosynthesis ABC-type transport system permease subunit